jgi:hypothetical protein
MVNNVYVWYVVVMLAILAFGAATIVAINYSLSVAKNFIYRDWRYRVRVLFTLASIGAAMLAIIIHWLMTPDS